MKFLETNDLFEATCHSIDVFNNCYASMYNKFDLSTLSFSSLSYDIDKYNYYKINLVTPANNAKGYEIAHAEGSFELDDTGLNEEGRTLLADTWFCIKEHYGLSTATAVATGLQMPIKKKILGHSPVLGSGDYTNLISHAGHKIKPFTVLKPGPTAQAFKSIFGTTRIFGIIGRAMPFTALSLAIVDIAAISYCTYEKNQ